MAAISNTLKPPTDFGPLNQYVKETAFLKAVKDLDWKIVVSMLKTDIQLLDVLNRTAAKFGNERSVFVAVLRGTMLVWNKEANEVFKELLGSQPMETHFSRRSPDILLNLDIERNNSKKDLAADAAVGNITPTILQVFIARSIAFLQTDYAEKLSSAVLRQTMKDFQDFYFESLSGGIEYGIAAGLIRVPNAQVGPRFVIDLFRSLIRTSEATEQQEVAERNRVTQERAEKARAEQQSWWPFF